MMKKEATALDLSLLELEEVAARCRREVATAVEYAETSDWPDPATVLDGVYAE